MKNEYLHGARLLSRSVVARDTVAFRLEKPNSFIFSSGQFTVLRLIHPDLLGEKDYRYLSIASAPEQDYLEFIVRSGSSRYKQLLLTVPLGTVFELTEPREHLQFSSAPESPMSFFAGGVGIAPFLSALRSWSTRGVKLNYPVTLIWVNRETVDAPYLEELNELIGLLPGVTMVAHYTREKWGANTTRGRLSARDISVAVQNVKANVHVIVGSHGFMTSTRNALYELGVSPAAVTYEIFCGYCPDNHEGVCCCTAEKGCCNE